MDVYRRMDRGGRIGRLSWRPLSLNMVAATKDQKARAFNREMAAEWLRRADAVRHPLKRQQAQMQMN
jgi:hypothetical protein